MKWSTLAKVAAPLMANPCWSTQPRAMLMHLSLSTGKLRSSDHPLALPMADCKISRFGPQWLTSSTHTTMIKGTVWGRSLINTGRRKGPSTEYFGTPSVTGLGCEEAFHAFTLEAQPVRNLRRICSVESTKAWLWSLWRIGTWRDRESPRQSGQRQPTRYGHRHQAFLFG